MATAAEKKQEIAQQGQLVAVMERGIHTVPHHAHQSNGKHKEDRHKNQAGDQLSQRFISIEPGGAIGVLLLLLFFRFSAHRNRLSAAQYALW